jgi:transaldolase
MNIGINKQNWCYYGILCCDLWKGLLGSGGKTPEEDAVKFFVDTAVVAEISELNDYGLLDGVTTNPSLIAKSGRDFKEVIAEICAMVDGPVSAEVAALDFDGMVAEGERLARIAGNVVVKLPLTLQGLKACRYFAGKGIKTNVTLCFSANQALLAAKAGATYISPFLGRLDDINIDGMDLIREMRVIYDNYGFGTQILAASIRSANHVKEAALAGADVATIPAGVIKGLAAHVLTDKGLAQFSKDWAETGQSIL